MAPSRPTRPRPRNRRKSSSQTVHKPVEEAPPEDPFVEDAPPIQLTPEEEQEQWEAFREDHYDAVEQLPLTLHRLYALLRELDGRYQEHLEELKNLIREYTVYRESIEASVSETNGAGPSTSRSESPAVPPREKTKRMLLRIGWLNAEILRISAEKIALSESAYNSVDRHVRSLDHIIKTDQAALALGLRPGTQPAGSVAAGADPGALGLPHEQGGRRIILGPSGSRSRKKSHKRIRERNPVRVPEGEDGGDAGAGGEVAGSTIFPRPLTTAEIDPNEPTYCYCKQVSFGEMVACDNKECPREWFHYACVGLTAEPKHRWYCFECRETHVRKRRS